MCFKIFKLFQSAQQGLDESINKNLEFNHADARKLLNLLLIQSDLNQQN